MKNKSVFLSAILLCGASTCDALDSRPERVIVFNNGDLRHARRENVAPVPRAGGAGVSRAPVHPDDFAELMRSEPVNERYRPLVDALLRHAPSREIENLVAALSRHARDERRRQVEAAVHGGAEWQPLAARQAVEWLQCSMCLTRLFEHGNVPTQDEQGHTATYHSHCLHDWIVNSNTCPHCRRAFAGDYRPVPMAQVPVDAVCLICLEHEQVPAAGQAAPIHVQEAPVNVLPEQPHDIRVAENAENNAAPVPQTGGVGVPRAPVHLDDPAELRRLAEERRLWAAGLQRQLGAQMAARLPGNAENNAQNNAQ